MHHSFRIWTQNRQYIIYWEEYPFVLSCKIALRCITVFLGDSRVFYTFRSLLDFVGSWHLGEIAEFLDNKNSRAYIGNLGNARRILISRHGDNNWPASNAVSLVFAIALNILMASENLTASHGTSRVSRRRVIILRRHAFVRERNDWRPRKFGSPLD